MTLHTPLWLQQSSYSATDDRTALSAIWLSQGVNGVSDLAVSQHAAGAAMSVDVATGYVVVLGTDLAGQHKYVCYSDAVNTVTITAAPGAGQSRNDIIVAQVLDADQDGGGTNAWQLNAIKGTAATTGSQVDPTLPASCVPLARVLVGSSVSTIVTGNITDIRPHAGMGNSLVANPAGRMYAQTTSTLAVPGSTYLIGNMVQDFVVGGVTFNGSVNGLVAPIAGRYQVSWITSFVAGTTTGLCIAFAQVNGTPVRATNTQAGVGGFPTPGYSDLITLAAGDYVSMAAQQNSGASQTTQTGSEFTSMAMSLVSRT